MTFYTKLYTTVSMKDALEAKERGACGADFLIACAQTPVYSVPASIFFAQSAATGAGAAPSVTITSIPAVQPLRKIPTVEEYNSLPKDQQGHWECLHCCTPALAYTYIPGSYCSKSCAYYGYL